MKVADLIAELQKLNPELPVWAGADGEVARQVVSAGAEEVDGQGCVAVVTVEA